MSYHANHDRAEPSDDLANPAAFPEFSGGQNGGVEIGVLVLLLMACIKTGQQTQNFFSLHKAFVGVQYLGGDEKPQLDRPLSILICKIMFLPRW